MAEARIVAAEVAHIAIIAADARQSDVDELWAQARATPAQCMAQGLRLSVSAFTGLIDDVPVCMFGATPYSILQGQGVPWMVGSTALDVFTNQKALLRASHGAVALLQRQFPLLFNSVDDRNVAAQRWLLWLGFTLLDPTPLGPDGRLFRPFYRQGVFHV